VLLARLAGVIAFRGPLANLGGASGKPVSNAGQKKRRLIWGRLVIAAIAAASLGIEFCMQRTVLNAFWMLLGLCVLGIAAWQADQSG